MNQKASKDKTEIEDALKHVETFHCPHCRDGKGANVSVIYEQVQHLTGQRLHGVEITGECCYEDYVLSLAEKGVGCECSRWHLEELFGVGYAGVKLSDIVRGKCRRNGSVMVIGKRHSDNSDDLGCAVKRLSEGR